LSREQTAYVGDDIKIVVNVIDSTGAHAAATINTTTTRLNGFSAAPTVNTIATGIYEIVFASVTPAPSEGDRLICKVNGDISGTAWTEYGVPVIIVADERGTDNASTFDASTDTVTTDTASRDASKADVSLLATAASIAALNDFDPATDTVANVTTVGSVTSDVTTDAASRTASQADVSALATAASIAALNDISAADVWTYSTRTITSGGITQAEVAAAVWNASLSGYNSAGSTGKALKQIKEGVISTDGSVDDTSATATTFISNLTETTDGFYHDKVIVFISGDLIGQARHIETYVGSTKSITVSQGFTAAPSDGDEFLILATHEHSLNEISEAVWSDTKSSYTTDGTFGYYLDAQVSSAGAGGSGLYQVTVNVQNQSAQALQGARINVDGTTLTLVTDSSGQCVFNLDSGVYLLTISPPAGYDTVAGNTVVVGTSDLSSTFTLTATSTGNGDVPWVG